MMKWDIDINCDVGEGVGNEKELFPLISSCNIACGGHTGNVESISEVIQLAKEYNVKIGAHPSYPDKSNFGRKVMDISDGALKESLIEQLSAFKKVAEELEVSVFHIKPHGALYNQIAKDRHLAQLFIEVVKESGLPQRIYTPFGSKMESMADEHNVEVRYEAFADRNYNKDGSLVSRSDANALISEPEKVLEHILPMIKSGTITTISKEKIETKADTICIHGDTPTALKILQYISQELPKHQITLRK